MKTYQAIPIAECHEPLVEIPPRPFAFTRPHPYEEFGAPYGGASPWRLRQGVLAALLSAQESLAAQRPGWRLKLFDAYRPVPVQAFMVWREFGIQAARVGQSLAACRDPDDLQATDPELYAALASRVFEFWSVPNDDPRTPPPHSTGAAVDLTLEDETGRVIDMGGEIDETTERSHPDFYASATAPSAQAVHQHRALLNGVMAAAGFSRHGNEWWHFSLGDQMWAWSRGEPLARYGRVE